VGNGAVSFVNAEGQPELRTCAVLYLDLLGVSALTKGPDALRELRKFDGAIRGAFRYRIGPDASQEGSALPAAVFSDSFVAAAPVIEGGFEVPEADAVFHLMYEAANLQTELAMRGYFARGAITIGDFHFHEGILFGPALVEAVELERDIAVNPRIVLSPDASLALRRGQAAHQLFVGDDASAPALIDSDGLAFVNYLERIFEDTEADPVQQVGNHRDWVQANLAANSGDLSRWSKHCWAAEYHNAICHARREILTRRVRMEELVIDSIHTERSFRPLL
jgi:hypothetical protein